MRLHAHERDESDACPRSADASPARVLAMERPDMRKNSGLEVCKYNESSLSSSRESESKALRLQSRGEEKERTVTGGGGIIGPNGSAC